MKTILHLCADIGSDSYQYKKAGYNVILVGSDIGVENFRPPSDVHGIIANPVCSEFSVIKRNFHQDPKKGMILVDACREIINYCKPKWWVMENPATGSLKKYIGEPKFKYHPWQYGSPWTKYTGLWGDFIIPPKLYSDWNQVPKNHLLYMRPGRKKPNFAFLHKSAIYDIPEFKPFIGLVKDDSGFRSLCSQKFAEQFIKYNP